MDADAVTVTVPSTLDVLATEGWLDDSEDDGSEDDEEGDDDSGEDDVWEAVKAPLVGNPIGPFSVIMDAAAEVAAA